MVTVLPTSAVPEKSGVATVVELVTATVGTPGAVVSITNALFAPRFVPILKLLIAFPAPSDNDPADSAIPLTVRSLLVSPLCTVYVPLALIAADIDEIVTVRAVSSVTTRLPPDNVTASLNSTVTSTVSPVL
jgi:hypothetical protein